MLRSRMLNPLLLRGFMLAKLPLALVAGLRVRELAQERCVVTAVMGITFPCGRSDKRCPYAFTPAQGSPPAHRC